METFKRKLQRAELASHLFQFENPTYKKIVQDENGFMLTLKVKKELKETDIHVLFCYGFVSFFLKLGTSIKRPLLQGDLQKAGFLEVVDSDIITQVIHSSGGIFEGRNNLRHFEIRLMNGTIDIISNYEPMLRECMGIEKCC